MQRSTLVLLCGLLMASLVGAGEVTRYRLKTDHGLVALRHPDEIARSSQTPLDRPYERFTEAEKASLRDQYEGMSDADEPPFPAHGLRPIIEDISTLVSRMRIEGVVTVLVTVDATGKATEVALVSYPDLEAGKAVAYVLVKAKYKPAVCAGQPCKMQWAFQTKLVRN
jgi:hypothetical protein